MSNYDTNSNSIPEFVKGDTVYIISDLNAVRKGEIIQYHAEPCGNITFFNYDVALEDGVILQHIYSNDLYKSLVDATLKLNYYRKNYTSVKDRLPEKSCWCDILVCLDGVGVIEEFTYDIEYDAEAKVFFDDEDGLIEDWTEYTLAWRLDE